MVRLALKGVAAASAGIGPAEPFNLISPPPTTEAASEKGTKIRRKVAQFDIELLELLLLGLSMRGS
jgi:hypothetical protein